MFSVYTNNPIICTFLEAELLLGYCRYTIACQIQLHDKLLERMDSFAFCPSFLENINAIKKSNGIFLQIDF
jgi:hypothetical protein